MFIRKNVKDTNNFHNDHTKLEILQLINYISLDVVSYLTYTFEL